MGRRRHDAPAGYRSIQAVKLGGWEGEIQTLTIQRKLRMVPNDNRTSDRDPAFRVMLGWQAIGDAWDRQSRSDPPRDYLRVLIDDPLRPMDAALFPDDEGLNAQLILSSEAAGVSGHHAGQAVR